MSGIVRLAVAAVVTLLSVSAQASSDGGVSTVNTSFNTSPRQYYLADFFTAAAEWTPGDTRYAGYVNPLGTNQLVAGRTGSTTISGRLTDVNESSLIVQRESLVTGSASPASATPGALGSLHFSTQNTADKATLENRFFFADVSDLGTLTFKYRWYRHGGGVAAPALKLGIDTGLANSATPTAVDRGENRFDTILVYEPYLNRTSAPNDQWLEETIDGTHGKFWRVTLGTVANQADTRTLADWAAALGTGTVNSLQLGVGSANPLQDSYVESLTYTNPVPRATATASTTWLFYPDPPPAGAIAPSDALIAQGDDLTLTGTAIDAAGQAVSTGSLLWYSSRDGLFGTGESASTRLLLAGLHQITLVAKDELGQEVGTAHTSLAVSAELGQARSDFTSQSAALTQSEVSLAQCLPSLSAASASLAVCQPELATAQSNLVSTQAQLAVEQSALADTQSALADTQGTLSSTQAQLAAASADLHEIRRLLGLSKRQLRFVTNKGQTPDGKAIIASLLAR